jgi:hypothetical protein
VPPLRRTVSGLLLITATVLLAACGEKEEPEVAAPIAQAPTEPEQPAPGPDEPPEPEPEPEPEPTGPNPDPAPPAPPPPAGQQIAAAVRGVLASGDPDLACRRYATVKFLAVSFGGLAGCRAATNPRTAARSVQVGGIVFSEGGKRADAFALPRGGSSAGQRVEVSLVVRGGAWRVDSLRSNVPVGP